MKKYLVGGAVRDSLLQFPIKEFDWVVVGSTQQEMLNAGYQQVGKDFPVFLHPENHEEYALARTEYKSGKGYTGFTFYTSSKVTLEEDLRRRDLTINAMARDEQGIIIDPYNGQLDVKRRLLRHVSDAFIEDPLRVLRVARFAAQFAHLKFHIAPETLTLMKKLSNELILLTPERVWKETEKALTTHSPQVYFEVLRNCGALQILFPEIDILFGIPGPVNWHPEIDTGVHTLMSISVAAHLSNDIAVRFATLCHDLGKGLTPKHKWPSHHGHGQAGVALIDVLCKRFKIPNPLCNLAKLVAKYHDILHKAEILTSDILIKLFYAIDIWRRPERLEQMIISSEADARGRYGFENKPYTQGNFLRTAYNIANTANLNVENIQNLTGIQIGEILRLKRQFALTKWKLTLNKTLFSKSTKNKI